MRVELKIAIFGGILFIIGAILVAAPSTVERTVAVPRDLQIINTAITIDPLKYYNVKFEVPPGANEPILQVTVRIYEGKDIDLIITNAAGQELYRERIANYAERTIPLPGSGEYEIRFSNTYSFISQKRLHVNALLSYKESVIKTEKQYSELGELGDALMMLGIIVIIIGGVIALVKTVILTRRAFREGIQGTTNTIKCS